LRTCREGRCVRLRGAACSLAAGSGAEASGAVFQIDADTLQPVGERVDLETPIGEVFPSPDLRTAVVLVPHAGYAEVDLVDGRVLRRADLGFEPTFTDVSPDGHRLAVGVVTGEVGLVDLETGEWVRPPAVGHDGFVLRVAYAPDGFTVASSGRDGRVSLWDGRTGDLLATVLPGRPNL
jgi:WD40 repeat protein